MFLLSALLLLLVLHFSAQEPPLVIFAQPGGSVQVPRTQWSSEDKIYVNWYFSTNAEPLISKTPHSPSKKGLQNEWKDRVSFSENLSLIISPVLESDFGLFICEQHEYINKLETKYQLYPVIMPTTLTLFAGDSHSLTCEVKSSPVQPTVNWIVPQDTIAERSGNKYTVHLNNVSDKHKGDWICVVQHGGQTLNVTTAVSIIDLSAPMQDPIYTSVTLPPPLIPCSLTSDMSWSVLNGSGLRGGAWSITPFASSAPPRPLLALTLTPPAWRVLNKTDCVLEGKSLSNRDLSVKSSQVSLQHRGAYTCSLHFTRGKTLSKTVQLEVLEVSSTNSVTTEGNTVNLTCTLGHPLPSGLKLTWIPPKTSALRSSIETHQDHLSIPAVRVQDSGMWKCELRKNEAWLTHAEIALTIEKGPVDVRVAVVISSGAVLLILLIIIILIIVRRRRQNMKKRKRKTRYCCCKNPQAKGFYKT